MIGRILGIGWVDADGPGRGRGETGCRLRHADLPRIERRDIFDKADRRFGRLDDFSRLGLAAIALALQDAGLDGWKEKRPWGIIAASRYGCLATDRHYFETVMPDGGALASPNLFAYTLSNSFTGEAAIRFGLSGQSYVINESGPSGFASLQIALGCLEDGEEPLVVAGINDLPSPLNDDPGHPAGAVFLVLARNGFSSAVNGPLLICDAGTYSVDSHPVASWNELVETARRKL